MMAKSRVARLELGMRDPSEKRADMQQEVRKSTSAGLSGRRRPGKLTQQAASIKLGV